MKKVYICHPFNGKKQNLQAITHICQALTKFGVIPISPVHSFSYLSDKVPEQRALALTFCEELVSSCDAIFLCGAWEQSEGCNREHNVALMEMIPIYNIDGWDGDKPLFRRNLPLWWKNKTEKDGK
ncbi:conserved hypothetical protein [Candidatus Desulfosporosinus infrequens]|uniref:DUF7768 domain-containing protein n=1 Tax=Candidatus Desulfosporosinus infrequens TaxID=2043169 RepID=A0A2U3LGW4_9FIRM|nr:conserved hypothetical protein [Candidatus Desulfosporosinus infrequens]